MAFTANRPIGLTPSRYNYFNKCPESRIEAIMRIVVFTQTNPQLHSSLVQRIWINRLKQTNASISYALGVGEALGLREFIGELYYIELIRMNPMPLQSSPAYVHPVISALEPHQKLALYQGYWSLRCYWSNTLQMSRSQTKKFECIDSDVNDWHTCPIVWREGWREVDDKKWTSTPFNPLKEMSKVVSQMNERGTDEEGTLYSPCAFELIDNMQKYLEHNIADHFLGPPPPISTSDLEASS
jgi:hypothetical protein